MLSPASSDQVTLAALTAGDRRLADLPAYKELLRQFAQKEVRLVPAACFLLPVFLCLLGGEWGSGV